ncbi:hypothetical protein Tco_0898423, partial [Tanacetum coccineum]
MMTVVLGWRWEWYNDDGGGMAAACLGKTEKLSEYHFTSNLLSGVPSREYMLQMQMVRGNGGNQFRQYAGQNVKNLNGYKAVQNVRNQVVQNEVQNPGVQNVGNQNGIIVVPGIANPNANQIRNGNVVIARAEGNANENNGNQISKRDAAFLQTRLLIAQKEEAWIQLQTKEFDFMAAAGDLEEIEEVNANCILMANLQQASTSGTRTDSAPTNDSDGSAENDNNVFSAVSGVEQSGGTIEQNPATIEETRAYFESLYKISYRG